MDIQQSRQSFDSYMEIYTKIIEDFSARKKEVIYPTAKEVLQTYSLNLNRIFDSMLESGEKGNLYSCSILYRSVIEHFLKAFYIFERTISDKNEDVSISFQQHYLISEFLAEKAGLLDMEDLQNGNLNKTDFLEFINSRFPEFEGFGKENQQEISIATKQFGLKVIIKHFHKMMENKNYLYKNVMSQMIPEFSRFSTFTHGGMYANAIMDTHTAQNTVSEEIARIIEITIVSVTLINESVILMYKPDKEVADAFTKLKNKRAENN
ncbi:DUF5677 domain-containing protein [Flavobacterium sp.]|uniref:DUF5677 domain-containing protein n=1 Tax=Flavobacterium sp. TaxID=239 RepID=UPI0031CF43AB